MPAGQRNVYPRPPNPAIAARKFAQILGHHEWHLEGPQHFSKEDIRALGSSPSRLNIRDQGFIGTLEEFLDAALWVEKAQVQDHQTMKDKRNLVLQLRYAQLTAAIHTLDEIKRSEDLITHATRDLEYRCFLRIEALFRQVKDEELAEDDRDCGICYQSLQNDGADRAPVRLPCSHIFCRKCATNWLGGDIGTCPSCRADFNLAGDYTRDHTDIMIPILSDAESFLQDPPSPWWIDMLRAE